MRISIPRKAAKALDLKEGDIVGFYEDNGNIVLRKMKWAAGEVRFVNTVDCVKTGNVQDKSE